MLAMRGAGGRKCVGPKAFGNALGESIRDEMIGQERVAALEAQSLREAGRRSDAKWASSWVDEFDVGAMGSPLSGVADALADLPPIRVAPDLSANYDDSDARVRSPEAEKQLAKDVAAINADYRREQTRLARIAATRAQAPSLAWGDGLSFDGNGSSFAALSFSEASPGRVSLSGSQRMQAHALGVYDAGVGAVESSGYSFGVVGTPESRAAWALQTSKAAIDGIRSFVNDAPGAIANWWDNLTGNDPAAIRQATAQGTGIAIGVGGGIVMGRLQGAPLGGLRQTGAGGLSGAADEAYSLIRASSSDVTNIADNTGIKVSNIQKVKDHLFYDEHLLDRYERLGVPGEMRRFDSNLDIANAWQRLEAGTFDASDMRLLRHETAEAWYMKKHGPSYNNSHNAAQKRYPSPLE